MLKRVTVALVLLAATCNGGHLVEPMREPIDKRIFGGSNADIKYYPYQVAVFYMITHICGGSIINAKWILTAAQCVQQDHSRYAVRAGSSVTGSGGTVLPISRIVQHEWYDLNTRDYDYALMQVQTPFFYGTGINQIALPTSMQDTPSNSPATVSGWGMVANGQYPNQLQAVNTTVTATDFCQNTYYGRITERMICAGNLRGADFCEGDAGGPMVVDAKLIGVASWGTGCASTGKPGVYAKVSSVRQWIDTVTVCCVETDRDYFILTAVLASRPLLVMSCLLIASVGYLSRIIIRRITVMFRIPATGTDQDDSVRSDDKPPTTFVRPTSVDATYHEEPEHIYADLNYDMVTFGTPPSSERHPVNSSSDA